MTPPSLICALSASIVVLLVGRAAVASAGTGIGTYSEQNGPGRAEIGGSVSQGADADGSSGSSGGGGSGTSYSAPPSSSGTPTATTGGGISGGETIPYTDPNFRGARARSPVDASGTACLYFPDAAGACPVAPAPTEAPRGRRGRARAPQIDPYAIAASIARNMPLLPGEISVNPPARGWTGVTAWFWLDPAPRTIAAVAVLGAERIVVTAVPSPAWSFGDDAAPAHGPGRPYRRGETSVDGAVRHRYETRCLPGDQGRNPYVLDSCTGSGYQVGASVTWTITFVATGPVTASGALPSRTTSTTATYPVSEVRAFLSNDDGGRTS